MPRSLLSLRAALIFLLAALTGFGAGVLTVLAQAGLPQAVLSGVGVFGLAVGFFDRVVGPAYHCAAPAPGPGQAGPEPAEPEPGPARVPTVGR